MATLSTTDLALIRDEVGTAEPTDSEIRQAYTQLDGSWLLVAIRILKRRRAAATAGGGVSAVTIPGAISVTLSSSQISSLDSQIARLEAQYAEETGIGVVGASFDRITRLLPR